MRFQSCSNFQGIVEVADGGKLVGTRQSQPAILAERPQSKLPARAGALQMRLSRVFAALLAGWTNQLSAMQTHCRDGARLAV